MFPTLVLNGPISMGSGPSIGPAPRLRPPPAQAGDSSRSVTKASAAPVSTPSRETRRSSFLRLTASLNLVSFRAIAWPHWIFCLPTLSAPLHLHPCFHACRQVGSPPMGRCGYPFNFISVLLALIRQVQVVLAFLCSVLLPIRGWYRVFFLYPDHAKAIC